MIIPTVQEMLRLPPGDRSPLLRPIARHHRRRLAACNPADTRQDNRSPAFRHRRALDKLSAVAARVGVDLSDV